MTNFDYRISANSFPPFNSFCGKYSIYAVKNCHPAVTYAAAKHQGLLFWTCKRLKLQRKTGHLQLIQNSAPSVAAPSMLHPNNAETIWKFSHFTLSKKNSFRRNYLWKYGISDNFEQFQTSLGQFEKYFGKKLHNIRSVLSGRNNSEIRTNMWLTDWLHRRERVVLIVIVYKPHSELEVSPS